MWNTTPVELQGHVLSFMSIQTLVALGATSRYHYMLMKKHIRQHVTSVLSRHGLPMATLDFMKEEKVVFSGSAVLDVMEPGQFVPNDLDIYVKSDGLEAVETFLCQHSLYVKVNEADIEELCQQEGPSLI
jgi:hypothetical protein